MGTSSIISPSTLGMRASTPPFTPTPCEAMTAPERQLIQRLERNRRDPWFSSGQVEEKPSRLADWLGYAAGILLCLAAVVLGAIK